MPDLISPAVLKDWLTAQTVDGNASTVEALLSVRLPELHAQLERQIARALPLELFHRPKLGPAALLKDDQFCAHMAGLEQALAEAHEHTKRKSSSAKNDFAGVYVFLSSESPSAPFYVGITRTVLKRIQTNHIRGKTHNTATLRFQLMRSLKTQVTHRREDLSFDSPLAQEVLNWFLRQKVAILPLACPVERYAFELHASMKLQTGRWNTFETH
jgi:hypothetical protein